MAKKQRTMTARDAGVATVSSGGEFMRGGSWAGQQLLKALQSGNFNISPEALRTLDTLRKDEWKAFDDALVEEGAIRLRAVADMIAAGNTIPVANGMGKTLFQYETVTNMDAAEVSLDGLSDTEDDRQEFALQNLPLPITHKTFSINLRQLAASRERGEALDTTQVRTVGRIIAEKIESMAFNGLTKKFLAYSIYGFTTHPSRNTGGFVANGDWSQAAKTGENIVDDVLKMIAGLEADRFYGPYHIYVPTSASAKIKGDYKAASDKTIVDRILEIDSILSVKVCDQLATANVVMVQPTRDVAALVVGEPLQNIQWDVLGGFKIMFKGFTIQVPLIRADDQGNCGVYHMS